MCAHNVTISIAFERFKALPDDTRESDIQTEFIYLVGLIAAFLEIHLKPRNGTKIIVGGILAIYEYDIRSSTDPHFVSEEFTDLNLIASEVKTNLTFAEDDMWYHKCRGVQVLSALYYFNCPTFLLTQKRWRLFVENSNRNAVLTFPYGDGFTEHANSSFVASMGSDFLKAIVVCLLSKRPALKESISSVPLGVSSQVTKTPEKTMATSKFFNTTEKFTKQSVDSKKTSGRKSWHKTTIVYLWLYQREACSFVCTSCSSRCCFEN